MSETVTFGTDGWRAVIGDGFTFDNLTRVATATAEWVRAQPDGDGSVVLGYDTRFQGEAFARHVARVMASNGVPVHLADTFVTTPAISWATAHGGRTAGIVITASHNPPQYIRTNSLRATCRNQVRSQKSTARRWRSSPPSPRRWVS